MSTPTCPTDAADPGLEEVLQELEAEFAPTTARERSLVATILLAERELLKLGRVSRLSVTPCDSPAFSRAFNSARNGRDQASRALDRLRDRAELAEAARKSRKRAKAAEDEDESEDEAWPEFNRWGERNIRDTGLSVPEIASVMSDGHSDAYILAEFRSLCPEDLEFCRAEMAKARSAPPGPSSALTTLALLIGLALGAFFSRGVASPTPARAAVVAPLARVAAVEDGPPISNVKSQRGDDAPTAAVVAAARPACPAEGGAARLVGAGPARRGMSPTGAAAGPERGRIRRDRPASDDHRPPAEVSTVPRLAALDAVPGGAADERDAALQRGADRGAGDHRATCV